ncbi:MAG: hypothetical protein GY832_38405, partial [Chloroflexi bacterium]|nr:hypothetical protein [Chloroflexota bacterium]
MFEESRDLLAWIRQTLISPESEHGGDDRSFALNIVALGGLVLALGVNGIMLVKSILVGGETVLHAALLIFCTLWFTSVYWLSRQGKADAASHLFLWGAIVLILVGNMADLNAGPADPIWQLFNLTVIGASLLLGTGWSFAFAVVGILLYFVSPVVKQTYAPDISNPSFYQGVMTSGALLISAVFVWLFRYGMENALRKSRRQAGELEHY